MASFEILLDEIGGFGRFQMLVLFLIISCQFTAGWSMLQMSFARLAPDFHCLVENLNFSILGNETLNVCHVNGSHCSQLQWFGSSRTATSEWSLICDLQWVQKVIISVQMVGVMLGGLLSGQLSDAFGRKKILYIFVLYHIICNFITAASGTWVMFCVMRFFTGFGIGAILVICFPYPMEFLPLKWRPICAIIPSWSAGMAVYAAAAILLDDWSYLHIACGVVSVPSLFGFFFVPESMRWLTMQGKLDEAEEVLAKIARVNKKPLPENTRQVLEQIHKREKTNKTMTRAYSFIDLFKGLRQTKASIILWLFWFVLSTSYYGISFGVASLHGNIFLNILLLGILEIPVQSTTFFTNNWFGRRPSTMFFFGVSGFITIACFVCLKVATGSTQGISINVLSMILKTLIGSAWSCIQVWGSESYPTVTRNLGYGFANSGARIGGIVAPFIIGLDTHMDMSYAILTGMLFASTGLCLLLPETKGRVLRDSCNTQDNDKSNGYLDANDVDHSTEHTALEMK